MNPARLKAYIFLLIATGIWGIASVIIKFTLNGISPLAFLTYRFAISSVFSLGTFLFLKQSLPKSFKTIFWLVIYGLFSSTIALGLLFFGLEKTTVLDETLITAINPMLIAIMGFFFLKEHITKTERLGMAIAFFGTLITVAEPLLSGNGHAKLSGNLLIVIYLLVNTFVVFLAKKLIRLKVSALLLGHSTFIVGFLTTLPLALFFLGKDKLISSIITLQPQFHLGVFYMALLSGSFAYFLWARAQKTIETGEAAVFGYLYPLFAAPLAILWLGEKTNPVFIIGAVFIVAGVIIAEYKKNKR